MTPDERKAGFIRPGDEDDDLVPRPGILSIYVIYDHPKDHPDWWVVRLWDVIDGTGAPRIAKNGLPVCGLFREVERAREYCAQFGLTRLLPQPGEDPCIVETWL
jgi:hypothetical protein